MSEGPQKGRRSKFRTAGLRARLTEELVEGQCPYCKADLRGKTSKTLLIHADKKCVKGEEEEFEGGVVQDIQLFIPPGELEVLREEQDTASQDRNNDDDGDNDDETEGERDLVDNADVLEQQEDEYPGWQHDFEDTAKDLHVNGSLRQTAAQIRQILSEDLGEVSIADIIHEITSLHASEVVKNKVLSLIRLTHSQSKRKRVPNSVHIMRRAIRTRHISAVEIHICDKCWSYAWKPCLREQWPDHAPECTCEGCTCPGCKKGKRFETVGRRKIKPKQVCYYLGLERKIKNLFSMEDFRKAFFRERKYHNSGSWWNSWHARWINGQTGGAANEHNDIPLLEGLGEAFQPENSVYSLHFDWISIKTGKKKQHSIGAIMLRCDGLDESQINSDKWAMPLMIIPGPKEPLSMNIHWQIIGDEFARLERNGLNVHYKEDGVLKGFLHKPFLCRFFCDAKAREKLLKCRGAAAKKPCPFCSFESSGNSKIFGYRKEVEYDEFNLNTMLYYSGTGEVPPVGKVKVQMGSEDAERIKYGIEDLRDRTEICEAANNSDMSLLRKKQIHRVTGLNGKCDILWREDLKAIHPIHCVYLPLYHLLILGIVDDFLKYIFKTKLDEWEAGDVMQPNREGVLELQKAPSGIIRNCDLKDPCIDTKNWSGFLISSLITFVETYSCFLFNEEVCGFQSLSPFALKAWGHLRKAVMYFIRDSEEVFDDWTRRRQEAQDNLLQNAKICEEHMPSLCVQNLHVAVCRLADQEAYCGRPNISNDMFTERTIRILKQFDYRNNHEASFVKRHLEKEALMRLSEDMGYDIALKLRKSDDLHPSRAMLYDDINGKSHLLGCGRMADIALTNAVLHIVSASQETLSTLTLLQHSSAVIHSGNRYETVKSLLDDQEIKNFSKIALVKWQGVSRLAIMKTFLRVVKDGQTQLRLAVCELFHSAEAIHDENCGTVYRFRKFRKGRKDMEIDDYVEEDFEARDICIPLSDVTTKVCQYVRQEDLNKTMIRNDTHVHHGYFWVYCGTSLARSGLTPYKI